MSSITLTGKVISISKNGMAQLVIHAERPTGRKVKNKSGIVVNETVKSSFTRHVLLQDGGFRGMALTADMVAQTNILQDILAMQKNKDRIKGKEYVLSRIGVNYVANNIKSGQSGINYAKYSAEITANKTALLAEVKAATEQRDRNRAEKKARQKAKRKRKAAARKLKAVAIEVEKRLAEAQKAAANDLKNYLSGGMTKQGGTS